MKSEFQECIAVALMTVGSCLLILTLTGSALFSSVVGAMVALYWASLFTVDSM